MPRRKAAEEVAETKEIVAAEPAEKKKRGSDRRSNEAFGKSRIKRKSRQFSTGIVRRTETKSGHRPCVVYAS